MGPDVGSILFAQVLNKSELCDLILLCADGYGLKPWSNFINRQFLPLRYRKAGRVLYCGARETHLATCHNGVTHSKTKEFLKSPRFFKS